MQRAIARREEKSKTEPKAAGNWLPDWPTKPFHEFLKHHAEFNHFLHLAMQAIARTQGQVDLVESLANYRRLEGRWSEKKEGEAKRQLEAAKQEADLARREVANNFPFLHAQAVLLLCSSFECLIYDFLRTWLKHEPRALQREEIQKIKIRFADYQSMTEEERLDYVVRELERDLKVSDRIGTGRFEGLLGGVGLSGPVPKAIQRDLFELYQIRNVLAHRRGLVDKKLAEACPWLRLKVGGEICIDHKGYAKYSRAVSAYAALLIHRSAAYFGVKLRTKRDRAAVDTGKVTGT